MTKQQSKKTAARIVKIRKAFASKNEPATRGGKKQISTKSSGAKKVKKAQLAYMAFSNFNQFSQFKQFKQFHQFGQFHQFSQFKSFMQCLA